MSRTATRARARAGRQLRGYIFVHLPRGGGVAARLYSCIADSNKSMRPLECWNGLASGYRRTRGDAPRACMGTVRCARWRAMGGGTTITLPASKSSPAQEDGAGTNRLWPIVPEFPEFAYAVPLRARPGLRFTGPAGGAATTLLLAFALALRLATLVGSTVATSIVSTLTDSAATISITLTLAGGAATRFS